MERKRSNQTADEVFHGVYEEMDPIDKLDNIKAKKAASNSWHQHKHI